ncbi:MAG TPA: DUF58 domain-containing protein [Polyangiaceae bacterium]|nr:DUF58 domain-containing protein [Polyangiaceae bacterium]
MIPKSKAARDRVRATRIGRAFNLLFSLWGSLTGEGRTLSIVLPLAAGVAIDVQHTNAYFVPAILFGLLVGSFFAARSLKLDHTTVVVNAPRRVTIGDEVTFSVRCRREAGADMAVRVRGPFLPWDGTWIGPPAEELFLQGGESATTTMRARFIARGMHHLDPFTAAAVAPLGLACGPNKESDCAKVWVVPRVADVVRLPLAIATKHQPGGVALASKAGESMDLLGVRPYRRGDPVRDLHARTWARTGEPAVREYQQEYFTRVGVIVDVGFRDAERLESAIELAAGVVARLSRGEALIDVLVVGAVIHELTVGRSLGYLDQALELLSAVEQGPRLRAESLVKRLEPHLAQLSTVFAIVSPEAAEKHLLEERLRDHGLACTTIVVDDDLARAIADKEALSW